MFLICSSSCLFVCVSGVCWPQNLQTFSSSLPSSHIVGVELVNVDVHVTWYAVFKLGLGHKEQTAGSLN